MNLKSIMREKKSIKKFISAIIAFTICLSTIAIAPTTVADSKPIIQQNDKPKDGIWINVTKEIFPAEIHPCEPATIAINVTAEGEPSIESIPIAVMLVIDVSGSMEWEYENETGVNHSALYYIKNAANTFIDQMDLTNDSVGVVSFSRYATLDQGLTHNGNAAKNAINSLSAGGATNTGEGIRKAQQELENNCPNDALPITLLFTDGLPTAHGTGGTYCSNANCPTSNNTCTDYARNQANLSKDANTTIFSIGFTGGIMSYCHNSDTVAFAQWLLTDISSGEDYYYDAPNATDIETIYLDISQSVSEVVISNLIVADFIPKIFIICNDGGGTVNVLANGTHKIEFTKSFLALNDSWNIAFEVTTKELGDSLLTNYANSNLTYIQDSTQYKKYLTPQTIDVTNPLEIDKDSPSNVILFQDFGYVVNISNIGHMILDNVTITDSLPNAVDFNTVESNNSGFDPSNWNYNAGSHTLNIYNLSMGINDKIQIIINVTVSSDDGKINNTVYGGYALDCCSIDDICSSSVTTIINNAPPVANDDSATTDEDAAIDIDVLANDTDPENDSLTITFASDPPNGVAVNNGNNVTYDPDLDYHGTDSFTYTISDGNGGTDTATVYVTIRNSPFELVKSVHYNSIGPWDDEGIVIDLNEIPYDWCTFRINVTNTNNEPLNITIEDVFPVNLVNGNHYYPRSPDYINENKYYWYYDGIHADFISPGETVSIGIRGEMATCNITYINNVIVTGYLDGIDPFVYTDNASVKWINCSQPVIDVNQSIHDRGFPIRHAVDGDWAAAQSFIPTLNTLTSAEIYMRKFGTPEFDLTVELRTDHPQGTLIDTLIFTPSEVSSSWEWFTLDFTDTIITPGTDYFIVCPPAPSGVTTSFGYEWGYAFGNHYDDGAFWFTRDGGGLWRDLPTMYEFVFRTYGYT